MIVLSNKLSIGQITFILRVIIQILSYGGIFFLGLLIFGYAPRIAALETHDLLNRVVGKSTSRMASLKWIFKRLSRKNRDPVSSSSLLIVLALSLCYGIFVSVSDVGVLGIQSCTIDPSSSFQDFPASIKSDSDALAVVSANMLNGTDPNTVKSHRCDAAQDVIFGPQATERVCTVWHNATYGNSSAFSILNSTDSDILMPKYLAHNLTNDGTSDLNIYMVGASGQTVIEPTIQGGLAVIPFDAGVKMIVGVPQLSQNQKVDIPKTLALEVDIACMSLGTLGEQLISAGTSKDFFVPDAIYLPERMNNYAGPDYLQVPLAKAADSMRALILPYFDTSITYPNGFYPSYNDSSTSFSSQSEVSAWVPPIPLGDSAQAENLLQNNTLFVIGNCTEEIHKMLNVSFPSQSLFPAPSACNFYQILGSSVQDQVAIQGHADMVCATTTQVNMVSATLETNATGALTYNLTRLPSNLNIVQASYFEVVHNDPDIGETTFANWDPLGRFTLSDDPEGPSQHYIYQEFSFGATATMFNYGSGSLGVVFSQIGSAMISFSFTDLVTASIINPTFFSANYSTSQVTKWAGGLGASYLLASVGYNGWAARGSQGFTVVSTGEEAATCYNSRYAAAFLPLVLAAIIVIFWALVLLFSSKIREAKRSEKLYGGLSPVIELPYPGKLPGFTVLAWEDAPEPHLKPAVEQVPLMSAESQILVSNMESDEMKDGLPPVQK